MDLRRQCLHLVHLGPRRMLERLLGSAKNGGEERRTEPLDVSWKRVEQLLCGGADGFIEGERTRALCLPLIYRDTEKDREAG